jgi:putative Ca2+/H+ antiporter (TMEM165/GDT1 family)
MLTGFTAGLLLITISELGDKTFFIAMLLAMRQSRFWVFVGAVGALAAMTVLSVLMGQVATLLPTWLIHYAEVALFLGFGLKLLYDASRMSPLAAGEEVKEAQSAIAQSTLTCNQWNAAWCVVVQAFGLTFMAEWGDRTQLATVALAATHHPVGVTLGAILGHTICTAIAVVGGRLVAGRLSERLVTALGGLLFLAFGAIAAMTAP